MKRLVKTLLLHPQLNFWVLLVLSLPMLYFASQVTFDYQIMDFFPKRSAERAAYESFYGDFEHPENQIRVAVPGPEGGVFQTEFLTFVSDLQNALKQVEGVRKVSSILTEKEVAFSRGLPVSAPWLHPHDSEQLKQDSLRLFNHPLVSGIWIGKDAQSLTLLIVANPEVENFKPFIKDLEQVLSAQGVLEYHMAGVPVGREYFVAKMEQEILRTGPPAVILVSLLLWLIFRTWQGVVFPILVIGFTLIWVLGVMYLSGTPINLLTNILPVVFIVVGVSDAVHFYAGFSEFRQKGFSRSDAVRGALKKIGWATLMTSMTTAIGFVSLLSVSIPVLRSMGTFAAVGVAVAFGVTLLLFPWFFSQEKQMNHLSRSSTRLVSGLSNLIKHLLRHRKWYAWSPLLLLPVLWVGLQQVRADNYFLDDLPPGDKHHSDFEFFEAQYGGVRTVDVHVRFGDDDFLSYENFSRWLALEALICNKVPCQNILSPLTPIRATWHQGPLAEMSQSDFESWKVQHRNLISSKAYRSIHNNEKNTARFTATIPDLGGHLMSGLYESWTGHLRQMFPDWDFNFTGVGWYVDASNQNVVKQLSGGFAMALLVVALLMGILFRHPTMVLIAMVINILPLLITAAVMGYLGIHLRITTAIVFSIVYGIAVDDTIHFLARYRYERLQGLSVRQALLRTSTFTGKAILLTTAILVTGFAMLIFSGFNSISIIGLLLTIALVAALVVDLTLLPVWIAAWQGLRLRKRRK
jgi:predicted RND superfamily exporter protein